MVVNSCSPLRAWGGLNLNISVIRLFPNLHRGSHGYSIHFTLNYCRSRVWGAGGGRAGIPTAQRLAYFASGVLELFRLGRAMPINLEELATELEAIKFNGQVRVGGETVTFDAAAVDTYVVPMDSPVTTQPTFVLDPKGQLPGPSTGGLKPKDLRIKWGGTPQSPTWEIVLK